MQRLLFVLFGLLSFVYPKAQNADKPLVADILRQFHNAYIINNDVNGYVTFEKRKEGWFVVSNRFEQNRMVPFKKELFYDFLKKNYKEIEFSESQGIQKEFKASDYLDEYAARYFDVHPFYGYPGWYKDVIEEYSNRNDLSTDELHSLARAYSTYSFSLFSDQNDDALKEEIWPLSYSTNAFTKSQLDEYTRVSLLAQNCFKRLCEQAPAFETTVGNIRIKYANEVVTQFHIFLSYAEKHAATIKLQAGLYPDSILSPLRRVLEDCPPSSVLVSFGDNDFYPVLYLQHNENLRPDVYLVNYNLLAIDRYIFRATKNQFKAPGIRISFDTSYYNGRMNEVIFIEDPAKEILFSHVKSILSHTAAKELERPAIAAGKIKLNHAKKGNKSRLIELSFNKERYMLKNHWILYDIIENLDGRKICFPAKFRDPLMTDLNLYLEQKGSIWIL